METAAIARRVPALDARNEAWRHWAWLGTGAVFSFLIPFVLADQLGIDRDIYYGICTLAVAGLFIAWARDTGQDLREWSPVGGVGRCSSVWCSPA
jgi:hypothetical protein